MATEVYTEETANGAKLAALLIDESTPLVRAVFDEEVSRMSPPSLQRQLCKSKNRLWRFLTPDQQDILYNSPTGVANSSEDFDMTLLILLLGRLCHMKPPKTGWSQEPPAEDNSPIAWIIRLKRFRNQNYGHIKSTALSQPDFDRLWEELSDILIELGGDPDRIVKRKAQNIDLDRAKMYMETFDKLLTAQSEDLIAIKENAEVQTTEMKEQTTEMKKQSEKLDNLELIVEERQKAILAEIKQQSPCNRIRVEVHATQVPNWENQPAMSQPEVPPQPHRPFVLQLKCKRVKKCQGCRQDFKDPSPPANVVIQHEDNYPYYNQKLKKMTDNWRKGYYHANLSCIKAKYPNFNPNQVAVPPDAHGLTGDHIEYCRNHGIPLSSLQRATAPSAAGPPPRGALALGPLVMGPLVMDPSAAGPSATGPFALDPRAVGPSATGPPATGPPAAGPFAIGPRAVGPSATGPSATGPSATGPPAAGPFALGLRAVGPHAAGPNNNQIYKHPCEYCGKTCKSPGGLTRHKKKCPQRGQPS